PPDRAGRFRELSQYDFADNEARRRFEELTDELRQQLLQSQFNRMAQGMADMSPERMAALKDMLAELNAMLAAREAGEEPDFAGFMERHGQFFPGNRQSLDELLEQMARSMAQMQALMASMSEEQRRQLEDLAGQDAGRGGAHRPARRPLRAHAERVAPHRPAGPVGAVLEAGQGPPRRPQGRAVGHGPRAGQRAQAL